MKAAVVGGGAGGLRWRSLPAPLFCRVVSANMLAGYKKKDDQTVVFFT